MLEIILVSSVSPGEISNFVLKQHGTAKNPIIQMQPVPMQAVPASTSPHAPTKRAGKKPPYWIKVVTSFDPATPNGYGLKGKFVNKDWLKHEQQGSVVVVQTKDFKTKSIRLRILIVNHGHSGYADLPNGGGRIDIPYCQPQSEYSDYKNLFHALNNTYGIPALAKPVT